MIHLNINHQSSIPSHTHSGIQIHMDIHTHTHTDLHSLDAPEALSHITTKEKKTHIHTINLYY